ncbi:sugar O-acetyltransferase [Arthrobacter sp. ISL-5]|uniref:sugar O-acetyltransferase n=1 Tax=Arthrobacter sp. ISL-5 TaxID=2819111 RepID=UPI001BE74A29|nr:sugar O-acetyltransferase [Arthrobacter sp. ISL-5]MBT2555599.1 sugar O-acetyltransferase [Arthrobacter sp. ISL-5]
MADYFADDPRTNRERMLAGDLDISDDPESERESKRAVKLQSLYTAAYAEDPDGARPILADLLGSLGEDAHIKPPLYVDYGTFITVGARTFINYNLTALDVAPIIIGEDCQIGPNVQLLTPTHPVEPRPRRDRLEAAKPITIGDNSVIGAGAVVTRDVPANSVAVGNPARVVRDI